jgi:hypothetical protein
MATQEESMLIGRDQFGNEWGPLDPKAPKKSLLEQTGRRTAVPMMIDLKSGETIQIGYVVRPEQGTRDSELWVRLRYQAESQWRRLR